MKNWRICLHQINCNFIIADCMYNVLAWIYCHLNAPLQINKSMKKGNCSVLSTIFINWNSPPNRRKNPTFVTFVAVKWLCFSFYYRSKVRDQLSFFKFCDLMKTSLQTLFNLQRQNSFETLAQFCTNEHEVTVVFEMQTHSTSDHFWSFQANWVRVTRKHANQEQVVKFAVNHRRKRTKNGQKWLRCRYSLQIEEELISLFFRDLKRKKQFSRNLKSCTHT